MGVQRLPRQSQATARPEGRVAWSLGESSSLTNIESRASAAQDVRSSGICIEEDGAGQHWATYQLGLPQIADIPTVQKILSIAKEMQPARCRLWRMYTDVFDKRPIVLSVGPKLGDGWLAYHSGVSVDTGDTGDGDNVIVSFGVKNAYQAEKYAFHDMLGSFGATTHFGFLAPYLDTFRVGRSRLSDVYPRNNPFVIGSLFSILWADRATTGRRWRGFWDARSWLDYTGFDRKLPQWRMEKRAASKAQLVPSWSEEISNHNGKLGAAFAVTIDTPARLGDFRLSAHDPQRQEMRLHEFFIHARGAETAAVEPAQPQVCGTTCHSLSSPSQSAERAVQAMHSELSLALEINIKNSAHSGCTLALPLLAAAVGPASEIPSCVRSRRALSWTGAWKSAGRTWLTTVDTQQ